MKELQILLAPDKEHQKAFPNVPIPGFHRAKSFKRLFSESLTSYPQYYFSNEPCGKKTCQICKFIVNTDTFSPIATDETFKINKDPLKCNSKNVVYLSECKKCKNPYVGKAQTKFRMRLSNYKSANKSFKTKKRGIQKLFHGHHVVRMIMNLQ